MLFTHSTNSGWNPVTVNFPVVGSYDPIKSPPRTCMSYPSGPYMFDKVTGLTIVSPIVNAISVAVTTAPLTRLIPAAVINGYPPENGSSTIPAIATTAPTEPMTIFPMANGIYFAGSNPFLPLEARKRVTYARIGCCVSRLFFRCVFFRWLYRWFPQYIQISARGYIIGVRIIIWRGSK